MSNKSEAEILAELELAASGTGSANGGLGMNILSLVFIKRNLDNVPVKVCAEIIGKSHSRVTEIASGRDYKRYAAMNDGGKTLNAFIDAIQERYHARGLHYTGDFCGNNSQKAWKAKPSTPKSE